MPAASRCLKTRCRIVWPLGVFALWLVAGGVPNFAEAQRENKGPVFRFEETAYDFGEVNRGQVVQHRFAFANQGSANLIIHSVHAACGCTVAVVDAPGEIPPGGRGNIEVKLDTADFIGPVVKTISIVSNEALMPERVLTVRAVVKGEYEVVPPLADFGTISPDTVVSKELQIKALPGFALTLSELRYDPNLLAVALKPVAPGHFSLTVGLKPGLPPQFVKAVVKLQTSSKYLSELVVPVRATIKGRFEALPSYLDFGALEGKSTAKRAMTLRGFKSGSGIKHRTELRINGRLVQDRGLVKLQARPGDADTSILTLELANDARHTGSVHGKVFLETNDATQREVPVDIYAFFR